MAVDALDPGPDNNYPYFPRNLDGTPNYERAGYKDPSLPPPSRLVSQDGTLIDLGCPVHIPTVDPAVLPGGIAR